MTNEPNLPASIDSYLQWLIPRRSTEEEPLRTLFETSALAVTLTVGGAQINATLVREDEYFEGVRRFFETIQDEMEDAVQEQVTPFVEERVRQRVEEEHRRRIDELELSSEQEESLIRDVASQYSEDIISLTRRAFTERYVGAYDRREEDSYHIHLRDATIDTGRNQITVQWWRGRLEAVDGFALLGPRARGRET